MSNTENANMSKMEDNTTPKTEDKTTPIPEDKTTTNTEDKATPITQDKTTTNTEDKATPNTEDKTTTNTEDKATTNTEDKATPNTEDKTTPKTEDKTTPSMEDKTTPNTEDKATPKTEDKTTPIPEDKTTPITQDKTTTNTEDKATPIPEDKTTPITEDKTTPKTEDKTMPIPEDKTTPKTTTNTKDKTTPKTEADPWALGSVPMSRVEIPTHPELHIDYRDFLAAADKTIPLIMPNFNKKHNAIVKPLTRGSAYTNHLWKVEIPLEDWQRLPNADHPLYKETLREEGVLVVKIYGHGTDRIIDRQKEIAIHRALCDRDLGSRLQLIFGNGHVYDFLEGEPCSDIHHPQAWRAVAIEMGRWHGTLPRVRLSKPQDALSYNPSIWATAARWIEEIPDSDEKTWGISKDKLRGELQYLADKLLCNSSGTPRSFVLGHGDLICGNILLRPEPSVSCMGRLAARFIDYEHATFCPRAFELANHFSEWAGFRCDYSRLPSRDQRRKFIELYNLHYQKHREGVLDQTTSHGHFEEYQGPGRLSPSEIPSAAGSFSPKSSVEPLSPSDVLSMSDSSSITPSEVDEANRNLPKVLKLMKEVDDWRGFPSFYCHRSERRLTETSRLSFHRGLCGIIQASSSRGGANAINFHYRQYGMERLDEYYAWRAVEDGKDVQDPKMLIREKFWNPSRD
ncbi:kinase-like domain-containing protein [Podospora conica]|nr:kinase-like domain-containing protein [Schizothecium conicum]